MLLDSRTSPAPAFVSIPAHATTTAGGEAADLARLLGFQVDAPEQLVLDVLLAEAADGRWAGLEAAVVCPRQQLKTWALLMSVLHDAVRTGPSRRIVWTSHLYRTTQAAFQDLHALADNTDWLRKRVRKVRTAKGEEQIEFVTGVRVDFLARSSGGGRGLTGDVVVLDEALFLSPVMMGALLPTLSSRPNPHVRYGSSPGLLASDVLRSIRDRGRTGTDASLTYVEWSSERQPCADPACPHRPGAPGCRLDDETQWAAANPALGRRMSVDYVRRERAALPPSEFMRERMGWWQDPPAGGTSQVIPEPAWTSRLSPGSSLAPGARVAFAVDTSWDRTRSWIAVAGLRPDGVPHVEAVASAYGTEWVAAWLRARVATWQPVGIGLQGNAAPASSLLPELAADDTLPTRSLSGVDVARASGMFHDAVVAGPLAHLGQVQLDDAVRHATIRPLGDAWAWDRKGSPVDIAPLVAVSLALYVLATTEQPKPEPERYAPRRIRR